LSHNVLRAIEPPPPLIVAKDNYGFGIKLFFILSEPTAQKGIDANHPRKICRKLLSFDPLCRRSPYLVFAEIDCEVLKTADLEHPAARSKFIAVATGGPNSAPRLIWSWSVRRSEPNHHQSIRVGIRQRTQKNRVHQAKYHDVDTDPQG